MSDGTIKFLDRDAIDEFAARARLSPRRRLNLNLHPQLSDPIQRFLNAGEPGSYVRPHRHASQRWEMFAVLRGRIDVLVFSDDGSVMQRIELQASTGSVVEISGGSWHSFVFASRGTVTLEIKPGPYDAQSDKEFAAWAPREEEPGAERCAQWLATASAGQRWEPQ